MLNFTFKMFGFIDKIYSIFRMVYNIVIGYFYPSRVLYDNFIKNLIKRFWNQHENVIIQQETIMKKKVKVGLLTNEIPPIVYGGVATWIVNFIKMFEDDYDSNAKVL